MAKITEKKGFTTKIELTRKKNECCIAICREDDTDNIIRHIMSVDNIDIPLMITHLEMFKMSLIQRWWAMGTTGLPPEPKIGKDVGVG